MERSSRWKRITLLSALVFASLPNVFAAASEPPIGRDTVQPGGERSVAKDCTGHASDRTPPKRIRVLLHDEHDPSGRGIKGTELGVRTVPFRSYVENVLPAEWPAEWPAESLRAGALAVKNYAWYWTKHWRGGEFAGQCYDVDDSITYQRYVPGSAVESTDAAVADTWDEAVHKDGEVFSTGYRATLTGDPNEPCGHGRNARPDLLSQWGSRACALEERTAEEILALYYSGATLHSAEAAGK